MQINYVSVLYMYIISSLIFFVLTKIAAEYLLTVSISCKIRILLCLYFKSIQTAMLN